MGSQTDYGDYDLTSYDTSAVSWLGRYGKQRMVYEVIKRDFIAGEYVWTGFTISENRRRGMEQDKANRVMRRDGRTSALFGIVDTAGLPKDSYYLLQSQWNDSVNTLLILPAWNEELYIEEWK